ncbi:hypothetical protein AK812_SmicGene45653 [Symbiodinium microadriaticum]|uniref:Uncharacterized protein n=1 Tax=Symbiodinium microadriaticum TaxID=2951 RepID=A0A1Q9BVK4_SYMMI|nr:hypothetical protein AK812_SmicGene45653 [Symbiodinium microadriaticum]
MGPKVAKARAVVLARAVMTETQWILKVLLREAPARLAKAEAMERMVRVDIQPMSKVSMPKAMARKAMDMLARKARVDMAIHPVGSQCLNRTSRKRCWKIAWGHVVKLSQSEILEDDLVSTGTHEEDEGEPVGSVPPPMSYGEEMQAGCCKTSAALDLQTNWQDAHDDGKGVDDGV